jgi:hypothetical protein
MHPRFLAALLCAGSALLAGHQSAWADPDRLAFPLLWSSPRGTLYVTTTDGDGRFAGKYHSADFRCHGLFPAAGRLAYDRLVFSVHFDRCGTFVSWNGFLQRARLVMDYRLVYTDPVSGRRVIQRGRDVLKRLP